jgi:arginyl-tRNA synthetase
MRDMWRRFLNLSMAHCRHVYQRLGVSLTSADVRGESAYNDDLPHVIADLDKAGLLTESQGAMCVFLPQFTAKDGTPLPLIVQKSDEGYLYATTDLAAIRYRVNVLHADRVLYVVDARQSLHFQMVFATARAAGFAPENVSLEHIAFGTMMGADGKPFRTRDGETVKLMDLLGEAVDKARQLVEKKNAEDVEKGRTAPLTEEQKNQIAEAVGIGAVKYADLSQNRTSDYVFSFEKMLSLDGNTAPYMQYAYARIRSIFRKGAEGKPGTDPGFRGENGGQSLVSPLVFSLSHPAERALAVKLLQFPETVESVADQCLPNILCNYLYELAGLFMGFYENCPVLQSAEPLRASRLALCGVSANVIRKSLELLGIGTIERM